MDVIECRKYVERDCDHEANAAFPYVGETSAGHVFHREERSAGLIAQLEHANTRRVLESSCRSKLALEAGEREPVLVSRMQHLHRKDAAVAAIAYLVNDPHTPF